MAHELIDAVRFVHTIGAHNILVDLLREAFSIVDLLERYCRHAIISGEWSIISPFRLRHHFPKMSIT